MIASPDMNFDVIIIGAGVVGLALAQQLARGNRKLGVLEKNDRFGQETSSRNSEVIHAGIYYPRDFLKSRLCVEGNRRLYAWCRRHDVPHARIGKLIIATSDEEEAELLAIKAGAEQNGVAELELLGKRQLHALEREVTAQAALFSPVTGIVDSHRLMRSFLSAAEEQGAILSCRATVTAITPDGAGYDLEVNHGEYRLHTQTLINSAGLHADDLAARAGIDIDAARYRLQPCKGNYFTVSPAPAIHRLVYPVPLKNNVGLGIHATLDLAGRVRFGPDSRYLDHEEITLLKGDRNVPTGNGTDANGVYRVDEDRREAFAAAIGKYLPGITPAALQPDMSGIRPKLQGPGDPARDFIIREEKALGLPGLINLIGIESPGLTASLAIAGYVEEKHFSDGV